jgi:hypothetical protein
MDSVKVFIQWAGLISWVGSALCLSVIGLRYAKGLVIPFSSLGKEIEPRDTILAKAAGVLFRSGMVLFIVAGMPLLK